MKLACLVFTVLIALAIMAVCVMVKFATDITLDEKKREMSPARAFVHRFTKEMGVIELADNASSALADRFPYVAAVTVNTSRLWSFACFGSVVLVKWLVTAAHCRRAGATHRVLLYSDFVRNISHTYPVMFWRLHENFNISNLSPKYDIAVAKVNVDPLSTKSALIDERAAPRADAAVWKTVSTMDKKLYLTNDFASYEVKIAEVARCYETFGIEIDRSLLCVDMHDYDDCFIHEFGPLFADDKVVGILALKPRDCEVKFAIFTNVSYYTDWILNSTHITYYE